MLGFPHGESCHHPSPALVRVRHSSDGRFPDRSFATIRSCSMDILGLRGAPTRLGSPGRNPIGTPNSVWARTPADNTLGDRDLDCRDRARRSLFMWLDQADVQFGATFDRTGGIILNRTVG
jgi:hypothetical protein